MINIIYTNYNNLGMPLFYHSMNIVIFYMHLQYNLFYYYHMYLSLIIITTVLLCILKIDFAKKYSLFNFLNHAK